MVPGKPKTLKKNNRKVIIDLLRRSGEMAVAEISREVGLSKTTVMKILDFCTRKGFAVQAGKGLSTDEGGKKPELFKFNTHFGFCIAIHIFPDEVYAALLDSGLTIVKEQSIANKEDASVETIVTQISGLVRDFLTSSGPEYTNILGIAVGAHGITDYDQGIVCTAPHFPSWGENVPLKDLLTGSLPTAPPLFIDNQIRFQVFAEKNLGAGQDKKNIIVIEGGEGLVAGIMVKDEIKRGVHYLAGEIGHMILNPSDDVACSCGGKGCFETLVSTNRVLRKAQQMKDQYPDSVIFSGSSREKSRIEAIFDAANSGDTLARLLLDDVIKWFTIGISNIILMYDPEIVIIQGVYSQAGPYFLDTLRTGVNTCSLVRIKKNVEIQYSNLGKNRGLLGGGAFIVSRYFENQDIYEL